MRQRSLGLGNSCCRDGQERHGRKDDQGELPAVIEGVDDGEDEDKNEENEHSNLLANALLKFVQISKI